MNTEIFDQAQEAAAFLKGQGISGDCTGIVLGSGLTAIAEGLGNIIDIPYNEIPHMRVSGAPGHRGLLRFAMYEHRPVLVFSGRLHGYEGISLRDVTFPVRIMQALGMSRLILTAAVGGLREGQQAGDIILVRDHINLMPDNPLRGVDDPRLGERFIDLSDAYTREWRESISAHARDLGLPIATGIYAGLPGPSLETQAECQMLRLVGADVVGMSVVPEVIVAAQAGIRVAALCVIANMAWHPGSVQGSGVQDILSVMEKSAPVVKMLVLDACDH